MYIWSQSGQLKMSLASHRDWSANTGWARFQTFGLRSEWVGLVLHNPRSWRDQGQLGPRQLEALRVWLRCTGLVDTNEMYTSLLSLFKKTWPDAVLAWEILWANVTFEFATARWYVCECELGEWSSAELCTKLESQVSRLAPRTVTHGIQELVGTLERTPIGTELGQGAVTPGRPRRIRRDGLPDPDVIALAYVLRELLTRSQKTRLDLAEDLLWPWVIFGSSKENILVKLAGSGLSWLGVDDRQITCTLSLEALRNVHLF